MILPALMIGTAGMTTGALLVNWIGLARAMRLIPSAPEYVRFHQATNRTFDPFMPALVMLSIITSLAAALAGRTTAVLAISAGAGFAVVLALSLLTNVRLNRRIDTWKATTPPTEWSAVRDRWVRYHVLRTLVAIASFGLALAAGALPSV